MPKPKVKYVCQECGSEFPKWLGRCPGCAAWNTLVEEVETNEPHRLDPGLKGSDRPLLLAEIEAGKEDRLSTGIKEFDRVLGGGVVPGSLVLVGGDPGIGKSTLLLQAANLMSRCYGPVLYLSGEESAKQVKLRSERLETAPGQLYILAETNLEAVEAQVGVLKPHGVVIDSIQTVYHSDLPSAPGSVSQVRECTLRLMRMAKTFAIPVFLVGHVTKEGAIAGPRVLEHMVDTVLYFEGERHQSFRILRAVKNRFGSTNEIGVFEMRERGLVEVENPSGLLLTERPVGVPGSVVVAAMEGTRPLLVEIQALVSPTPFGTPRRTTVGVDYNRVALMMAVLEKRLGLHLASQDAFVNVAGGVRLDEPAIDLGLVVAIASSFYDRPPLPKLVVMGEVGLTGEVRGISKVEQRIHEAAKFGFTRCIVPRCNMKNLAVSEKIELQGVEMLADTLAAAFGGE